MFDFIIYLPIFCFFWEFIECSTSPSISVLFNLCCWPFSHSLCPTSTSCMLHFFYQCFCFKNNLIITIYMWSTIILISNLLNNNLPGFFVVTSVFLSDFCFYHILTCFLFFWTIFRSFNCINLPITLSFFYCWIWQQNKF